LQISRRDNWCENRKLQNSTSGRAASGGTKAPPLAAHHSQPARVHTDFLRKHCFPPKIRIEPHQKKRESKGKEEKEKREGVQWAVREGRLQSRFGKSGVARKLGLVQIVVEASAIRGGFPNTQPSESVSGLRCRSVLMGLWGGAVHPTASMKIYANFKI